MKTEPLTILHYNRRNNHLILLLTQTGDCGLSFVTCTTNNRTTARPTLKLYIKYMVSIRCKMVVKEAFKKLGLHYVTVNLGEVNVLENITDNQREKLRAIIFKSKLELMDDKKAILIERIKAVIVEMIHYSQDLPKTNFSDFLSKKLSYDYTYLANLFSITQGTTIEHYIIMHKIE